MSAPAKLWEGDDWTAQQQVEFTHLVDRELDAMVESVMSKVPHVPAKMVWGVMSGLMILRSVHLAVSGGITRDQVMELVGMSIDKSVEVNSPSATNPKEVLQ